MFWGKKLNTVCAGLRAELDDHLDAINGNTADVGEVREGIALLDEKIEKLASRIDELYLLLGAEGQLTSADSALQAYLQSPRSITEIAAFIGETTAAAERRVRMLFLKGVLVHQLEVEGAVRFTTNRASVDHVSLSRYFGQ